MQPREKTPDIQTGGHEAHRAQVMAAHSLAGANLPCSWLMSPQGALQCMCWLFPSAWRSGDVSVLHCRRGET